MDPVGLDVGLAASTLEPKRDEGVGVELGRRWAQYMCQLVGRLGGKW